MRDANLDMKLRLASFEFLKVRTMRHGLDGRRAYITQVTQRRLHQVAFRAKVLRAHEERYADFRKAG